VIVVPAPALPPLVVPALAPPHAASADTDASAPAEIASHRRVRAVRAALSCLLRPIAFLSVGTSVHVVGCSRRLTAS